MVGKTLAQYDILEPLGKGGMGEVYRARDTKLDRDVAIKVLPEDFAADLDRLARFEREAKILASLNHAGIAAIYGLEDDADRRFIVMELVDGETLADRIARSGPLEVDEALGFAAQIAAALEAAHDGGVIHRDLKPANVKVTLDGKVKVLDFGLAKAWEAGGPASGVSPDLTNSPTTPAATRAGVILGTAAYMSPEQARGKPLDKRTDVWSFGAVLYEMLTGRQPFARDDVQETLAAVLRDEPDWRAVPHDVTPAARHLLRRCLQKDPLRRLRDIGDARIELQEPLAGSTPAETTPAGRAAPTSRAARAAFLSAAAWALGGVATVIVLALLGWLPTATGPQREPAGELTDILTPEGVSLSVSNAGSLALSPDGSLLAFVGGGGGAARLYLRPMDELEARPIPETEGASSPFFSPDNRWLGFVADDVLWKIELADGEPRGGRLRICDALTLRGASWSTEGWILFNAAGYDGLQRVPDDGSREPDPVTVTDPDRGEMLHTFPQLLPGGRAAVFVIYTALDEARRKIAWLSLDGDSYGTYRELWTGGGYPRYVPSGHLLYGRLGSLYAVPFDAESGRPTGDPQLVVEDVAAALGSPYYAFAVSADTGSLVYASPPISWLEGELLVVDRRGGETVLPNTRKTFSVRTRPALSPDEKQIAATILTGPYEAVVQIYDIERGDWTTLAAAGPIDGALLWEGDSILFQGAEPAVPKIVSTRADGTGVPHQLTFGMDFDWVGDLSSSGDILAFARGVEPSNHDVMTANLGSDTTPQPFHPAPSWDVWPVFSPDDRYIAYESTDDGGPRIWVAPYPGPGPRVPVTAVGAESPIWQGSEIFYVAGRTLWTLPVTTDPEFRITGAAVPLFEKSYLTGSDQRRFSVSADGQRFLLARYFPTGVTRLVHFSDFLAVLRRRVPTDRFP